MQQQIRHEVAAALGDVRALVNEQVNGVQDALLEMVRAEIQQAVRTAVTAAVTQAMQQMIPQTLEAMEALRGKGAGMPADGGPQPRQPQDGESDGAGAGPEAADEEQLECRSCKSDMNSQQIQCTNSRCRRDQPGVPRQKKGRDRDTD